MINYWKGKEKWDDLRQRSKILGVSKSKSLSQSQEEKLIAKTQNNIAEMYKQCDQFAKLAGSVIAEAIRNRSLGTRDAIRLLKDSNDIKMKLLGIEERHKHDVSIKDSRLEKYKNMTDQELEFYKNEIIERLTENE